jgi:hypothetical protein
VTSDREEGLARLSSPGSLSETRTLLDPSRAELRRKAPFGQMSVPRGGGLSSGVSDDRGDERHGGDCQVAKPAKGESCDGISFEK